MAGGRITLIHRAAALGDLFRARWRRDCGSPIDEPPMSEAAAPPWPEHIQVDFTDVEIGIARTQPGWRDTPELRETERLGELRHVGIALGETGEDRAAGRVGQCLKDERQVWIIFSHYAK